MPDETDQLLRLRHSTEHVLMQALRKLGYRFHMAMGPATAAGFYFDFELLEGEISELDFPKIEKEMKRIVKQNLPITGKKISEKKARQLFAGNPYKQEWIDQFTQDKKAVTVYYTGDPADPNSFVDLCAGPHLNSTGEIKAFKLLSIAGAYWHGDEKNIMLTRIYGTAFPNQDELKSYLHQRSEAKKRDHRKLGRQLDLFVISDTIGKGLPLLTPKGTIIRQQIIRLASELEEKYNFMPVATPHIAKTKLYQKTGHWQHYREVMYAPFGIDDENYVLKPMNCPHHYEIYASRPRSYRDLPFRLSEDGTCYRYEKSGELAGLLRVRALTIDDAHILMTDKQIESEFGTCIQMVAEMLNALGLNEFYVRLSLADPSDAIKYIADEKTWKIARDKLRKIIKDNHLQYVEAKGEASFYGPKLDYIVKDSLGREWQMSTLQLDLFMGKKLNLTYVDAKGQKKHPVILHRGLTGSIERTLAILIEHFAGAFPTWLAPDQVVILPISDKVTEYADSVNQALLDKKIRSKVDNSNDTIGNKIRINQQQKPPYLLVLGEKEAQAKTISVRTRSGKQTHGLKLAKFIQTISTEIESRQLSSSFN